MKFVNFVVDLLINRCGYYPNSRQKLECAGEIIEALPGLKDPGTDGGYVSIEIGYIQQYFILASFFQYDSTMLYLSMFSSSLKIRVYAGRYY